MLKIGFIGSGFIAHFMAEALTYVRNAELSGVYRRGGAEDLSAFSKENELGPCTIYDTIEELCRNCDAVAVLVPNFARLETVRKVVKAVENGADLKGIICEKPLGRTVPEAQKMVDMAEKADLLTAYFENQIHMPAINNAMEQLKATQQEMGPLTLARCAEEHAGPHSGWFWDPTKQGGGVLSDMGCHSIAVGWYMLTPPEKPIDYLKPVSVMADVSLLKWGQPKYRDQLNQQYGVDYADTPAEDFSTGIVTFRNPDSGQLVKAQYTVSWMYDKQGLRLLMDGLGPGYAMETNTLKSPLEIFIGDEAAQAIADAETALEKSTASRGLLAVQPNETDLYGYVGEFKDMVDSFRNGKNALLDWDYGYEITRLVQAAYMSAERGKTIDLTDPDVQKELDNYQSLISQGKGGEVL